MVTFGERQGEEMQQTPRESSTFIQVNHHWLCHNQKACNGFESLAEKGPDGRHLHERAQPGQLLESTTTTSTKRAARMPDIASFMRAKHTVANKKLLLSISGRLLKMTECADAGLLQAKG